MIDSNVWCYALYSHLSLPIYSQSPVRTWRITMNINSVSHSDKNPQ
ncbi:hypothetical protein GHAL_1553 [Hafnia alvei ATCC 13337]|uniref:Uncharacterized protein n=1 Tax=Hafnia alvei ATCC 13337 TaxID=910996 RepID=A0ABD3ZI84_HAFAL|nr:hypothetical protein GHAL_1553 [Hafnia alvei ATCC 13337]